jgi:hypothetical protein
MNRLLLWRPWFAWHPVTTVSGQRYWLKKVYRRYTFANGGGVEFADIFDLLREKEEAAGS